MSEQFNEQSSERPKESEEQPEETTTESTENRESIEAAKKKLDTIMGEDFRNFGVRFANVAELESILSHKTLNGRECIFFDGKHKHWNPNLKEYIKNASNSKIRPWHNAMDDTGWDHTQHSVKLYRYMLNELHSAHTEAIKARQQNPNDKRSMREITLDFFKKKIRPEGRFGIFNDTYSLKSIQESVEFRLKKLKDAVGDEDAEAVVKKIDELNQGSISSISVYEITDQIMADIKAAGKTVEKDIIRNLVEGRRGISQINKEAVAAADAFYKNPDLIDQDDNLRKLFSTIPYLGDELAKFSNNFGDNTDVMNGGAGPQYNVVLVFNNNAVTESKSWGQDFWRYLKSQKLGTNNLMGVVVIMPDREMVEKVVELSQESGAYAFPVLMNRGNVAFPK